ncbi:hypothetical protein HC928_00890 [bacterium]|nr:hypothetical protein [bacterium]
MQSQDMVKAMRPALVIGLGGTGQEVLIRLKARLIETIGPDVLGVIKLAALDTRDERLEQKLLNGNTVRLDRNTELLDIGNVPTLQVLQRLEQNYPQIKVWLPDNIPGQSVVAGAKQIRPLGRMAFFFHYTRIKNYLDNLIQQLSNINKQFSSSSVRAEEEPGLQIYLVSSVCGGTGSGIFLDTAYLIRHLSERLNQPKIDLIGFLVLPQAFTQVPSDQIKANAYAALQELDQFSRGEIGNNFEAEYPGGEQVSIATRPFKLCYLVDGLNEEGKTLAGMAELSPMIAESIFIQIGSNVGRRAGSAFDNLQTINNPAPYVDDQGVPHYSVYSGFGMSSLNFPALRIIDVCGRRLAHRIVTQGILANPPTLERIKSEVASTLDRLELRRDQILDAVRRDQQDRLLTLTPERKGLDEKALNDLPKDQLVPSIAARVQQFETQDLGTTIKRTIDENNQKLQKKLADMLVEDIYRMTDDSVAGGLLFIEPYAGELRRNIEETIKQMTDERKQHQEELSGIDVDTRRKRLQNALGAMLDIGGGKRKEATVSLLNAHRNIFRLRFEIMRLDAAIQILSVLINRLDEARRDALTLIDHLTYTADRFKKEDEEKTRTWDTNQSALNQSITSSADLEVLYQQHAGTIAQHVSRITEPAFANAIHTWRSKYPTPEELGVVLLHYAMDVFEPVSTTKLEDEVMRKRNDQEPNARLELLRTTSKPFWSIQSARVPEGGVNIEPVDLIAVENQETSIYKDALLLRGTAGVSTLDPHRITVLQTKHGVPVSALAQYDDYRRIYDQYMYRKSVPLHIFPKVDPVQAQTMFALAEAFGYISEEGLADFILRLPDGGEYALGKGFLVAYNRYTGRLEYITRTERLVEDEIKRHTKTHACEKIEDYLQRPLSENADYKRIQIELRQRAETYKKTYLM